MNDKEKLISLLILADPNPYTCESESGSCELTTCTECRARSTADLLIANGVTVQEWISVKDRLPEKDGGYLVVINYFGNHQSINVRSFAKAGETVNEYDLAGETNVWYRYDSEYGYVSTDSVTHWTLLPALPKGE